MFQLLDHPHCPGVPLIAYTFLFALSFPLPGDPQRNFRHSVLLFLLCTRVIPFLVSLSPHLLVLGSLILVPFFTSLVISPFSPLFQLLVTYPLFLWLMGLKQSYGFGTICLLPSSLVDNFLYVKGSPFNLLSISHLTHSIDCVNSFTRDFVVM